MQSAARKSDNADEHADWLAAYDAYDPAQLRPLPKREEVYVWTEIDGDFLAVIYERCAQCKQLGLVGKEIVPYYVKAAGTGKPGDREVVIRWLHPGECADDWHQKYREWKANARSE